MNELPPRGERLNIGLFGRRNVGKSSLLNALCGQNVSIVSDTAGTTTDAVLKPFELIPVGAVTFFDTAGLDDVGELGQKRILATQKIIYKSDIALLVTDERTLGQTENSLIDQCVALKIPFVVVFNKNDNPESVLPLCPFKTIAVSAKNNLHIEELKHILINLVPKDLKSNPVLIGDLIKPFDTIICITPIDDSAPKGRLILPQVQVIRDILDAKAYAYTVQNEQDLVRILENMKLPPALVVTDSQIIHKINAVLPKTIPLTTFSTLFARYKGDLNALIDGAKKIPLLQDGDKILIAEACSHHIQKDDIARVKMPAWIKKATGKNVLFDWCAGSDFPNDLEQYALVIHCGGCMLSRLETIRRLNECTRRGVAVTNFGIALSETQGILERVVTVFK